MSWCYNLWLLGSVCLWMFPLGVDLEGVVCEAFCWFLGYGFWGLMLGLFMCLLFGWWVLVVALFGRLRGWCECVLNV